MHEVLRPCKQSDPYGHGADALHEHDEQQMSFHHPRLLEVHTEGLNLEALIANEQLSIRTQEMLGEQLMQKQELF
jgi:hypothetical protein